MCVLVTALKIEVMKTKIKNSGLSKNGSVQGYISNLIVQLMFLTSGFFVVTVFIHVQVKVIHSESDRRKEHYHTRVLFCSDNTCI